MKIKDVMTTAVQTCRPDTDLATVAGQMWEHDCGIIPVVGDSGRVVGLVTDRDICIAAASRRLSPAHISAEQVTSGTVHACFPDDSVAEALSTMKQFQVHRLPVIDAQGLLKGIVSMNDLVRAAGPRNGVQAKTLVSTLAAICEPRSIAAA